MNRRWRRKTWRKRKKWDLGKYHSVTGKGVGGKIILSVEAKLVKMEAGLTTKSKCVTKLNLCNIITTSSKEVIFMKIYCLLIYLNRIIVAEPG